MRTPICDTLGIEFPISAFTHCRDVVAAVSEAGGFGVLGAVGFPPEQLEVELKWIAEHIGDKPYGVEIVIPGKYEGASLSGHVKKYAPNYGMEVIVDVPYSPRAADVSTEVGKIKAAGADVVMDTGYFGDGVRVLKTMRDQKLKSKGIIGCGNGAFSHPKFVDELGALTENVMDGHYCANPRSPLTKKAFDNYKAAYGTPMGPSTVFSYQPVYVLADALERAKSTKPDAVRDALSKTDLKDHILPQGPIVFGPDGQNKNAQAAMMQILGGKIVTVWPEAYAEAKYVFPRHITRAWDLLEAAKRADDATSFDAVYEELRPVQRFSDRESYREILMAAGTWSRAFAKLTEP